MTTKNNFRKQAKTLSLFRKIHRKMAAFLFVFFFLISISGILLSWKKNSGGLISPTSQVGSTTELNNWLPIDSLNNIASSILHDSISANLSTELNRIDIRKNSGLVKFVYENHYWGIQLDGATGKLLSLEKRRSDFIENVHDGTIFDKYLGTNKSLIKLIYSTLMGLALLAFTITGFWLWYGPIKIKRQKRLKNQHPSSN